MVNIEIPMMESFFFASGSQFYKAFYFFVLIKGTNKLECLILACLSSLAKFLLLRPEHNQEKHLSGAPL
jgi:hypothetical protein